MISIRYCSRLSYNFISLKHFNSFHINLKDNKNLFFFSCYCYLCIIKEIIRFLCKKKGEKNKKKKIMKERKISSIVMDGGVKERRPLALFIARAKSDWNHKANLLKLKCYKNIFLLSKRSFLLFKFNIVVFFPFLFQRL